VKDGFSLLELLVVIGLVALLSILAVPAWNSLAGGGRFTQAAYDASGLLELARSEAVSRQTYVWVGFQPITNEGNLEIRMAAVASRDGSATNTSASNLQGLTRVLRMPQTALTRLSDLNPRTQDLFTPATASVATNSIGLNFSVGKQSFVGKTITFTPKGEALLQGVIGPDDGYDPYIDVSFRKAQGTTVKTDADDAAVIVDGGTGTIRLIRQQ